MSHMFTEGIREGKPSPSGLFGTEVAVLSSGQRSNMRRCHRVYLQSGGLA
jgi:hypothetical protein